MQKNGNTYHHHIQEKTILPLMGRRFSREKHSHLPVQTVWYIILFVQEIQAFLQKKQAEEQEEARLDSTHLSPETVNPFLTARGLDPVASGVSLGSLLRRPQLAYEELAEEGLVTAVQGKGFYVNAQDSEMLKEQHLRKVESSLMEAITAAEVAGMTEDELMETLRTLLTVKDAT